MSGIVGTSHSKSKVIGRSQDTAKAWVVFNSSVFDVLDSFNVICVEDEGVGTHRVQFANDMQVDANYSFALSKVQSGSTHIKDDTSHAPKNYFDIETRNNNDINADYTLISAVIFGD